MQTNNGRDIKHQSNDKGCHMHRSEQPTFDLICKFAQHHDNALTHSRECSIYKVCMGEEEKRSHPALLQGLPHAHAGKRLMNQFSPSAWWHDLRQWDWVRDVVAEQACDPSHSIPHVVRPGDRPQQLHMLISNFHRDAREECHQDNTNRNGAVCSWKMNVATCKTNIFQTLRCYIRNHHQR